MYWNIALVPILVRPTYRGDNDTSETQTTTSTDSDVSYKGWKTYLNEEYEFSFLYPEGWSLEEEKFEPDPECSTEYCLYTKMALKLTKDDVMLTIEVDPYYGDVEAASNYYDEEIVIDEYTFYKRYTQKPKDPASDSIKAHIVEETSQVSLLSFISLEKQGFFGINYDWIGEEEITYDQFKNYTREADQIVRSLK